MLSETETWLPVPGYEGLYSVSDHGRVRSETRVVTSRYGSTRTWTGRPLACKPVPHIIGRGRKYPCVTLYRDGVGEKFRIHALVLLAFRGPRPQGEECLHTDDDPNNNNLSNLRYGTHEDNGGDITANRTHCKNGHEFTPANTRIRKDTGTRQCKACERNRRAISY